MGVSVVNTYASLSEAQVARCALESAGFPAWVFDEHYGTMIWTQQRILNGFRLVVPRAVGREAWEFLRAVQPQPQKVDPRTRTLDFWAFALLATLAWGAAWSWAAYKNGPTRWRAVGCAVQFVLFLILDIYVFVWLSARTLARLFHLH